MLADYSHGLIFILWYVLDNIKAIFILYIEIGFHIFFIILAYFKGLFSKNTFDQMDPVILICHPMVIKGLMAFYKIHSLRNCKYFVLHRTFLEWCVKRSPVLELLVLVSLQSLSPIKMIDCLSGWHRSESLRLSTSPLLNKPMGTVAKACYMRKSILIWKKIFLCIHPKILV